MLLSSPAKAKRNITGIECWVERECLRRSSLAPKARSHTEQRMLRACAACSCCANAALPSQRVPHKQQRITLACGGRDGAHFNATTVSSSAAGANSWLATAPCSAQEARFRLLPFSCCAPSVAASNSAATPRTSSPHASSANKPRRNALEMSWAFF